MSLPEIITRLRGRKKPVRSTQTPTVAAISTTSAPTNLTDIIKKFNDNTEDTALALEALKTDVDTKTATTITLSPTAINLPAESTANVTLHVDNLNLMPDGTVFNPTEPPTPVTVTTLADTDLIHVSQQAESGTDIAFSDLKSLILPSESSLNTLADTDLIRVVSGASTHVIQFATLKALLASNSSPSNNSKAYGFFNEFRKGGTWDGNLIMSFRCNRVKITHIYFSTSNYPELSAYAIITGLRFNLVFDGNSSCILTPESIGESDGYQYPLGPNLELTKTTNANQFQPVTIEFYGGHPESEISVCVAYEAI